MENKKTRLISEFIKFGITGGLGTVTNLLIFFLLVDLVGFPEILVSVFCFLVAGIQNYIINSLWSFREYTDDKKLSFKKLLAFLSGSLVGLCINIVVMYLILNNFTLPWKFIAQGCGIAAGMLINFAISKLFIFKKQEFHE